MFYERLKRLCAERGTTPTALLRGLGLSTGSLANYKKGTVPKGRVLRLMADALGLSVEQLLSEELSAVGTSFGNVVFFRVIGKVRAGYGALAREESLEETCPIPAEYLKGHGKEDFFVLRIWGDSMYPKLLDGDNVLVERCSSVESGAVAIVLYDSEEATVKTVRYVPGEDWMELIPANPEYAPKRIEGADLERVQILGRVRTLIRDM